MTPELQKKRTNNLFLLKIVTYLQHLWSAQITLPLPKFLNLLQFLDLDSIHSGPKPRRDFGFKRLRLRKTCLDLPKHVSRYLLLVKSFRHRLSVTELQTPSLQIR